MKYIFVAVYVLVLATQLPHVWYAYASIEIEGFHLAQITAIGAALAFEASTGIFTYRIVKGSRRRWTRWGLMFFIVASIVANGFYYDWAPRVFGTIWPAFATIALPFALALFAEEFGAEVKLTERRRKRAERKPEATERKPAPAFATKREHIRYLLTTEPGITPAELVAKTGASASYVSEVCRNGDRKTERTEREKEATES